MPAGSLLRTTIGTYRLVDFIGAGGMGEVYRAIDQARSRIVAIKVLSATSPAPGILERFRNEARIHASLHHPHIATMYEFLQSDAGPSIAMEFVDGQTLEQIVGERGALPLDEALSVFAPVVDAVGYLHQRGVVHRDLKSNNVKVSETGVVKLLDFGIAKSHESPKLTTAGNVVGTLHYLAPELLRDEAANVRSDIWALGVLLYELVTGAMPFEGGVVTMSERIIRAEYADATALNVRLPRDIDRIISRCLRPRPEDRYASAEALLTDVRALHSPDRGSPALGARPPREIFVRGRISGDVVAGVRARGPLVASITAAGLGLAFLVWSLSPSRPTPATGADSLFTAVSNTARDSQPVLGAMARGDTIDLTTDPADTRPTRTMKIDVMLGRAEVIYQGRSLGLTPVFLRAPIGSSARLLLRQPGYEDTEDDYDVTVGKSGYSISMRAQARADSVPPPPGSGTAAAPSPPGVVRRDDALLVQRRQDGSPSAPAVPLIAGWLSFGSWFRRRRRPASTLRATAELSRTPADGSCLVELRVEAGVASDPGCVREINEDAIRIIHPAGNGESAGRGVLAVVCDGMGGHEAGEIASHLAVETIVKRFTDDDRDPGVSLTRAVQAANRTVYDSSSRNPKLAGMGTTCTALMLRGGLAYCAHVGDSRCYLVRNGEIFLMTEDHSAVMELVRQGVITRAEARHHPDKNVISRALGSHRDVAVTSWPQAMTVRAGDRFVICSDGLYDLVEDETLLAVVREHAAQTACDRLVAIAREHGGHDNISVAVLVMGVERPSSTYVARETRSVEVMP